MRKIKFKCAMAMRHVLRSPGTAAEIVLIYWGAPRVFSHGIRLWDDNKHTRDIFVSFMGKTLDLIAKNSPVHFKRVTREIRCIMHLPCHRIGLYERPLRLCTVDLTKVLESVGMELNEEINEDMVAQTYTASLLVHEATHGCLYSRGILQTKSQYNRVEQLCCRQQNRFWNLFGMPALEFEISDTAPTLREKFKVWKDDVIPRILKADD